ncbi:hypothetical protein [Lacticaseibacillus hulanensis]|jgi:hypothetical protein|uniref:hypothetical protein n=1 Tax=Lacticaseibacillus hulanensis TaxID=2493111 RepID=UPI000FD728D9|nr:hypothetical protein [Lacticaseibacillus hulanensis]
MQAIVGIGAILLGVLQMYIGYRSFKKFKLTANAGSSAFSAYGLWYGFIIGVIFAIIGVATLTGSL